MTVLMTALAACIFGAISVTQIPVELLPDLSYPTLTVQTEYADAAPVSIEQFVTRPVEEAVGVIPGVRQMRSVSRAGLSEVILEFEWDEPMDRAAMEVREKLGLVELPRDADRPRVLRFDPALDPIVRLAFRGERPLGDLRQVAERWIKPRLEAVKGVAAAKVRGGLDPEVQVDADEDRLAALGLTLDDLAQSLRAENVNQPGGTVKDWGAVYLVRTLHEFDDLDQLRRTVVRENDAGRVRVEDVATVRRGYRDREEITRDQGAEVVEIALHREGAANTINVAAAIREELVELGEQLDEDLSLVLLSDQATFIESAVEQVWSAALVGGLLAILVLYFFLRDPASTGIVAVTIPVSVLVMFLPMLKAGVTLNIMSLGGLALGVGMLVDNSIVVLESIDRRRREGMNRSAAAAVGGSEVAGAVTAATLTTVAVFVPIVFVQGVAGQLFFDLAVTVCLSLTASLVVSLTVIPMLAALEIGAVQRMPATKLLAIPLGPRDGTDRPWTLRLGKLTFPPIGSGRGVLSKIATVLTLPLRVVWRLLLFVVLGAAFCVLMLFTGIWWGGLALVAALWWVVSRTFHAVTWPADRLVGGLSRLYPAAVDRALAARWAILPIAFGVFVVALATVPRLGTELVPDLAQGEFAFRLEMIEGSTLASSSEIVERIEDQLVGDPRFRRVFSTVGSLPSTASGRQTRGEHLAQINFVLNPDVGPDVEAAAVDRVRRILARFPTVEADLVRPSVLTVQPPVAVDVYSEDLRILDDAAGEVARLLQRTEAIADVSVTSEPGNPEITVDLDRERAAPLGIRADDLSRSLRRQIRGEVVGEFREQAERIDIRLRASAESRSRPEAVASLRYRLDGGETIPISSVARVRLGRGPAAIHRASGARVARVSAEVTSSDLGGTLEGIRESLARLELPGDAVAELSGQQEELTVSYESLKLALALAVFMVYVVMAVQFESVRYPFVILLSVPLGIVGVVLALFLTGTGISVLALIGAVMLAGIVVNNAIVLVDAINRRRRSGESLDPAIRSAGAERLRPILMTTATTVLALMPMALGLGAGAELRRPLAITVIGGLAVSGLLTLIVIPCLYRALSRRDEMGDPVASAEGLGPAETAGEAV